jgi:curved DNA-binding protein CbpA
MVTNAFEILGLNPRLTVGEEALRCAFRESGKSMHPDAGGGELEFSKLREAFEIIASPSKRLKHWLDLRGTPAETRGTVDPPLMDLFAEVGRVSQLAERVIRKREEAKSALGLALLEQESQICREAVEKTISLMDTAITHECSGFLEMENTTHLDVDDASKTARNLAFLEKWRTGLRSLFSRLV